MKIPLYTSQGQMSRDTPGRSISARMSMAGPRAIQEQGKVLGTAISEVNQFATMRYNMITEINRNEAIFGAKEQLAEAARTISKGKDFLKALDKPPGENTKSTWEQTTEAIRNKLYDTIGPDRVARQQFNEAFKQTELSTRFSLRDLIDTKIEARLKAAAKSNEEQLIARLSNPYGPTMDDVEFELQSHDQMINLGIEKQIYNPELKGKIKPALLSKIAKNVAISYGGQTPSRAIGLQNMLKVFDALEAKVIDEDTAKEQIASLNLPQSNYVSNLLLSIPRNEAYAYVAAARKSAISQFRAEEYLLDAADKQRKTNNDEMFNLAYYLTSQVGMLATQDQVDKIKQIMPTAVFESLKDDNNGREDFESTILAKGIANYLNNAAQLTSSQQNTLRDALLVDGETRFKSDGKSDSVTYSDLYAEAIRGNLSIVDLDLNRPSLSQNDWKGLVNLIYTKSNAALADARNIMAADFEYNELDPNADKDLQAASKAAFEQASSTLTSEVVKAEADGNPMTSDEIITRGKTLFNGFEGEFREIKKQKYVEFLNKYQRDLARFNSQGSFVINTADPYNFIADWYESLEANQQENARTQVNRFKRQVQRYEAVWE